MMIARAALVALPVCLLFGAPADGAEWTSLRTDHFLLLGDASPRAIKDVALRFEQFRAAVTTAFPVLAGDRPGPPVVVVVFRDQRAYAPYQPRFNGKTVKVGGYFLGAPDVNYITLATDTGVEDFRSVYHEYTHLLLQRLAGNLSPWFHEGLAEYFSTFDTTGNIARFGRPIQDHVGLLRERQMPVPELFAVTRQSTTYNEGDRRSLFYAQSWLLVHYAFVENPDRWKQLVQFDSLVGNGTAPESAFQQAFAAPPAALDKELFEYVRRPAMHVQVVELDQKIATRIQAQPARISEAEAQARLGDLLAHAGRNEEATALLESAMKSSPDLPLAHAALGTLLLRQDKRDEAMAHLERAASAQGADEFVQFYYAAAMIERAGPSGDDGELRKGIAALERAIQLRSGFTDAERMLGYAYLAVDEPVKARDVLRRALDEQPANEELRLMLAEAHLRAGQFADARALLGPLVGRATDARIKERARDLLGRSVGVEQQQRVRNEAEAEAAAAAPAPPIAAADPPAAPPPSRRASNFRPVLRIVEAGETRTYGLFTEIECTQQQIVVHVRTPGDMLLLRASRFDAIDFISYRSTTPGTISCGARRPAEEVYVTWRRDDAAVASGTSQGTVVAVELLPDGFVPGP